MIGQTQRKHRHQEFLRFLRTIDQATPPELDLHLVLDNNATHTTPVIQQWLLRHPRSHLHCIPTYSGPTSSGAGSPNLTNRKLRRSTHRTVGELEADVHAWIEA